MPVTHSFDTDRTSSKHKKKALGNLYALLKELPVSQQILLDNIGVEFLFHDVKNESAAMDYKQRLIAICAKEFSAFDYNASDPSDDQRFALSSLKEEVIHFLAEHYRFDCGSDWISACQAESKQPNKTRDKLFRKQRQYDSSSDEEKLSLKEYAEDGNSRLVELYQYLRYGHWEFASEFLVDLLLVRDYLRAKEKPETEIEQTMQAAFPNTYKLALGFESHLDWEAGKVTHEASLASGSSFTKKLLLENLQHTWDVGARK